MMRSLSSAISGLRNHQIKMDVIGNNIANVNTVGFKQSSVSFSEMLSQTLQPAASGAGQRGGTNPIQIGMGMGVSSIAINFTDGSFQPTGKETDLAIEGQGFFVVSDGETQFYTRAGSFDFDELGNFIVPGSGNKVMGWRAVDGILDTNKPIEPIVVASNSSMPAKATTQIPYTGNLSSSAPIGTEQHTSIEAWDSNGIPHKVSGTFTKTGALTWKFLPGNTDTTVTPSIQLTDDGLPITVPAAGYTITFDANGKYVPPGTAYAPFSFDPSATTGGAIVSITPDFTGLTQYGTESTAQSLSQNGYGAGVLQQKSIDPNGMIIGVFSNSQTQILGQLCLSVFSNPGGLNKIGDSLFTKSSNSGEPQIGTSQTGGRGKFSVGTLEMSNVDLAQEFSNMIITQRGFQANSKIITTTDEMLQELANLKR